VTVRGFAALLVLGLALAGTGAPAHAQEPAYRVLVFSKTAGFRHDSIPAGIAAIERLGAEHGFAVDATEDGAAFTDENLTRYATVVWLSASGDVLTADQRAAFERYVRGGGGFAGVHATSDAERSSPFFGELVGARFAHHPHNQDATVVVPDRAHPSTRTLQRRWTRHDEWYSFDVNPRGDVHVLATLDERSYDAGAGAMGHDHPIAWCRDVGGGRSWYTALGHTIESFSEPAFLEHLLGGIESTAGHAPADCGADIAANFEKVLLTREVGEPMTIDIAPDGRVFHSSRDGVLRIYKPDQQRSVVAADLDPYTGEENGLQAAKLDPGFAANGWIYVLYSPAGANPVNRLSRFTVEGDSLDLASERVLLEIPEIRGQCCHNGGNIDFDAAGNLYFALGDDTSAFESQGFAPIDERLGREAFDAQRTAGSTNDLNGKIVRIHPEPDGTYTIPPGNLFPPGTAAARPEIYVMGLRNPFRFAVDPERPGRVLWGDYGPDASAPHPDRGPAGTVELSWSDEPVNAGWPYCTGANVPFNDYDFATGLPGPKFDCANLVNDSPHSTGLSALPPAAPAETSYSYGPSAEFPEFGSGGGGPMGGPVYDYDPELESDTKFPAYFDGQWFAYEWTRNWIKTFAFDDQAELLKISPFLEELPFDHPMDLRFGPDGSLYVLEYGTGWYGGSEESALYRIDYVKGTRRPVARARADRTSGPVPLTVAFSSAGSFDPDPEDSFTYAWDFDGDGTTDSTLAAPTHTYSAAGEYLARLTVTDTTGKTGTDAIRIVAGNTEPTVTLSAPPDGGFVNFGDEVPYEVAVTDPEEPAADCAGVHLEYVLGHDSHGHPLSSYDGCRGTIRTGVDDAHGPDTNVFGGIVARYTDGGSGGAPPLTGEARVTLHTKIKQAEFFSALNGVQIVGADGPNAGQAAGFIDDGDSIHLDPVSFEGVDALRFRVSSVAATGRIEVRLDDAAGPLLATAALPNSGDWYRQLWTDPVPITDPGGSRALVLVFRNGGFNVDAMEAIGPGVGSDVTPPRTNAALDPEHPDAPAGWYRTPVEVTLTATDPSGIARTEYRIGDGEWTPYSGPFVLGDGSHVVAYRSVDALGNAEDERTLTVNVDTSLPSDGAGCDWRRSDEFTGRALDRDRWTVIGETEDGLSVGGGALQLRAGPSMGFYAGSNSAQDVVLQPAPSGAWTATARITFEPGANYEQAGLMLYGDPANYAKVDLLWGGGRRLEFIRETGDVPRNEAGDGVAVPAGFPSTFYLRLESDGTMLTAAASPDGETFTPVGRPAPLAGIEQPQIGLFAINANGSPTGPVAAFDRIDVTPDEPRGGPPEPGDEFEGDALDGCRWSEIVRESPSAHDVAGGRLRITTEPQADYGQENLGTRNLILQPARTGDYTIETEVDVSGLDERYQQAGLMVYAGDDDYVKFDVVLDNPPEAPRARRIELRSEVGGAIQSPQPQFQVPAEAGDTWHLRLTRLGDAFVGEHSQDGRTWTAVGEPVVNTAVGSAPSYGVFALGYAQTAPGLASFGYFRAGAADRTPPATTATLDPAEPGGEAGWHTAPVRVTLEAADDSGVGATEYRVDGGAWTRYAAPFTVAADGSHAVDYRSTDVYGNAEPERTVTFAIDATAPVLSVDGVADGARYGDSETRGVTFAVDDAASGAGGSSATLDGEALEPGTGVALWRLDLGTHELVVTGADVAGHSARRVVRFEVGTSFEDVARLLDAFRGAGRLTDGEHLRLGGDLDDARRASGGVAIALLEKFAARARRAADREVGEVLERDAEAIAAGLG
jgi:cytochrome c